MPVIDLNNIKTQIKAILDASNTTTASTDLSSGMETRVQKVLKLHPARIPIQATWHPYVTVFLDQKDIDETTMQASQAAGKRKATIGVKIVGVVWNSTVTDAAADDASDDAESLMENIEQIMRGNPTLNGIATWSRPEGVTFHNMQIEEETHIRAGMMSYRVTVFY